MSQPESSNGSKDELLTHEYDGIREYDNPMPRWWVRTFWLTTIFAGLYFFHYHISSNGQSLYSVLAEEQRAAEAIMLKRAAGEKVTEESLEKLRINPANLAAGVATFEARCKVCHAAQGTGLIGPNLTDGYWLHGKGTLLDIHTTVTNGVTEKGMPAWMKQLSPLELRNVVAYVGSLRGKNLLGKAPQGELIAGAASSAASAAPPGSAVPVSAKP